MAYKTHLLAVLIAVLISIAVLSINTRSAYANPTGQDTWGLSPNQNYVDLSINQACNPSNPNGPDSDGDGICDKWENGTYGNGLHIRFSQNGVNYSYDLSCDPNATISTDPTGYTVCPSPTHKDVYAEVDWMQGHGPSTTAINDVVNAFNNSPVTNGDGVTGVHLHVQYGENPSASDDSRGDTNVHVTSLKVSTALWNTNTSPNYGYWVLKENRFGTVAERTTTDPNHNTYCVHSDGTSESWHDCGTAKRQSFHYAVYIHKQYESTTSSGWAEINGNDLVMSLGALTNPGTDEQEASFMHELGHNFGLYHGGAVSPDVNNNGKYDSVDDAADNCKPNYLSIMSYTYEFRNTEDQCRPLDYSRIALNNLNESSLSDSNVGSNPYPNPDPDPPGSATGTCNNAAHNGQERPIWYSNPSGTATSGQTNSRIDWNGDGNPGPTYTQNINNLGTIAGCSSTYTSYLRGHNDWTSGDMNYNFRTSALFTSGNATTADTANCDGCNAVVEGNQTAPMPETFIDSSPTNTSDGTASFSFHSDIPASTFECQLDGGGFSACSSPQSYSSLVSGQHALQVRATYNGQTDSTPASEIVTVNTSPQNSDLLYIIIGLVVAVLAVTITILATVSRRR